MLDLLHASRLDQFEAAFRVLGKRLAVEVREGIFFDFNKSEIKPESQAAMQE